MQKIQIKLEQRLRNIMITLLIIWLRMSERWKTRSVLSKIQIFQRDRSCIYDSKTDEVSTAAVVLQEMSLWEME